MDALVSMIVVASGLSGWIACLREDRVALAWKALGVIACLWLPSWLLHALDNAAPVWTTGVSVGWVTLTLSLAPMLAWPVRSRARLA
jgi:hypothetical protein